MKEPWQDITKTWLVLIPDKFRVNSTEEISTEIQNKHTVHIPIHLIFRNELARYLHQYFQERNISSRSIHQFLMNFHLIFQWEKKRTKGL